MNANSLKFISERVLLFRLRVRKDTQAPRRSRKGEKKEEDEKEHDYEQEGADEAEHDDNRHKELVSAFIRGHA